MDLIYCIGPRCRGALSPSDERFPENTTNFKWGERDRLESYKTGIQWIRI